MYSAQTRYTMPKSAMAVARLEAKNDSPITRVLPAEGPAENPAEGLAEGGAENPAEKNAEGGAACSKNPSREPRSVVVALVCEFAETLSLVCPIVLSAALWEKVASTQQYLTIGTLRINIARTRTVPFSDETAPFVRTLKWATETCDVRKKVAALFAGLKI